MLLEAECWEVHTTPEDLRFRQYTNTAYTINLHFHVWITKRIPKVRQMRSPSSVLSVAFDDDSVLVQRICQCKGGLRFLP